MVCTDEVSGPILQREYTENQPGSYYGDKCDGAATLIRSAPHGLVRATLSLWEAGSPAAGSLIDVWLRRPLSVKVIHSLVR